MVVNKNRSDQKKEISPQIYQKTTRREHQKLRENPKIWKNHGIAHKSTIIKRLRGDEEEDLTASLYNSSRFSPHTP